MIIGIYEGLAAREAGLNQHDVIVKVDGKSPATPAAIKEALGAKEAGDTITLTVIQKGTQRDVKVKLDGYDAEKLSSAKLIGVEPTPQIWSMLGEGRGGDVRGMAIPGLKNNELFVVPDRKGEKRELIAPVPETRMRELYRPSFKPNEGVEKQLERLDARMGELEQLLEKLIERQERNR
jgi:hypothetical protein